MPAEFPDICQFVNTSQILGKKKGLYIVEESSAISYPYSCKVVSFEISKLKVS